MFEQLTSWDNLLNAYKKACKGKRGKPNVAEFEYHLEENLLTIQQALRSKTYVPSKYYSFHIHEPKKRLISAAAFKDRVVHHALCNLIEPVFDRSFIYDSYANRSFKGTHKAISRCQHFSKKYDYVLQFDLCQFFPSIDHEILIEIITKKINDPDVMWLCSLIINSGVGVLKEAYKMVYFPGDDLFAPLRPRGLPIGNLTSQLWANVYLNPFDHYVKRVLKCRAYIRYVDDCMVFSNSKKELWQHKAAIETKLQHYRLTMHPTNPKPVSEGIPFLGFIVFPFTKRIKRRKAVHFHRTFRKKVNAFHEGKMTLSKLNESVVAWVNHAHYGNTVGIRKKILSSQLIYPIPKKNVTK
jgi:retron-type reverse transcriptase